MNKEERDRLQLLRRRTFSEVFDDLGRLLRSHSGSFFKTFALIPGPFILVTGLVSSYLGVLSPAGFNTIHSVLPFLVLIILSCVTGLLLLATVVAFMREVELHEKKVSVASVRQRVFGKIRSLLTWFIVWLGVSLAISFGVGLLTGFLSIAMSQVHPELPPFIFFLFFLFIYPLIVHLAVASAFGMLRHDLFFGKAFSKAWDSLLIGFWRNWSLTLLGTVLLITLIMASSVPELLFAGIYNFLTLDPPFEGGSGYVLKGLAIVRYSATNLIWCFFLLLHGLNYYSHHEIQSGESLLQRFEKFAAQN